MTNKRDEMYLLGRKFERERILKYIEQMEKDRRAWAASPEGIRQLGPGSPTIPGLQDMYQIMAFIENRPWPDR